MKKRLRKKKRVGEFKELGFVVHGDLRPGMAPADLDAFVERFVAKLEARDLAFGGSIGDVLDGLVARDGRGSATDEDRAHLVSFLEGDADVVRHEVGALRDAWYGWK